MTKWLRRMRGVVGMGVTWAAAWALGGLLIGVSSNLLPGLPWAAFFDVFDAPLPALAIPGFVAGALFSVVLAIAGRRRRFDQLSLPRFAAWGALGGLLLSLVPAALVAVGLASIESPDRGLWQITAVISGPFILFSAVSASAYLILARMAEDRGVFGTNEDVLEVSLADGESRPIADAASSGAEHVDPMRHDTVGTRKRPSV